MENKSHAFAAGAFVLVCTALLVGLAMWLLRDVANTNTYEMVSDDPVTGLQPQAAVRFKGVAVGKVTTISFDPTKPDRVLVRIAVSPQAPITRTTFATLTFQGVTGLSFVQLDDPGGSREPPAPGPNGVPRIPLKQSALGQLTERAGVMMDKIDQVADRVNRVLSDENQAALTAALTEIGSAARGVTQLASTVDGTVRAQLDPARASIPRLLDQANVTLKSVQGAADRVSSAANTLGATASDAQQALGRVTGPNGVLERLSTSANTVTGTTLPRIQTLTEDASRTIRRLDRIANTLGENPQSFLYGTGAIPPGPGEPGFGEQRGAGEGPSAPAPSPTPSATPARGVPAAP